MEITKVGPFLEYLDRVHERTRRVVDCVRDEDLEWEAAPGRMTPGEVVSASALAALLFAPVARLADLASVFEQAGTSLRRLSEILDQEPDVREPAVPARLGRARGRVEFDGVGFGYQPGRLVLEGIRLRVEPGTRVALVGPTGCGKTTLINLMLRFYDPLEGEVRLDGSCAVQGLRGLVEAVEAFADSREAHPRSQAAMREHRRLVIIR